MLDRGAAGKEDIACWLLDYRTNAVTERSLRFARRLLKGLNSEMSERIKTGLLAARPA